MTNDEVNLEEKLENEEAQTVNQENSEVAEKVENDKVEVVENTDSKNTVENKTENTEVVEEKSTSQEDEKKVELADNIVKESKATENTSLPVDVKPYLEVAKDKLLALGKATIGVLEKIGDFVENLFKKKN